MPTVIFLCVFCALIAQANREPQLETTQEPGWYSCILQNRNSNRSVHKYTEIYDDGNNHEEPPHGAYPLYNRYGYRLKFSPSNSQFILNHPPAESVQVESNVYFEKYDNTTYFFDPSEFEKGPVITQFHFGDNLSLYLNCIAGRRLPPRRYKMDPPYQSTLHYSYPSNLQTRCRQRENHNQLSPEEQVFSLDNALGEYPKGFQIPIPLQYGREFDTYMGVTAYGNRKKGKYQCTELVHRFFKDVYNVPTQIGLGLGHGKDLALNLTHFSNEHNPFIQIESEEEIKLKFVFFDNGCSTQLPTPGSSISFSSDSSYGHVAIVRKIEPLNNTMVLLHLFQQAGLRSRIRDSRYLLVRDHNGLWRGRNVIGWSVPVTVHILP